MPRHAFQQPQSQRPLVRRTASADRSAVRDDIRPRSTLPNPVKQVQRGGPMVTLGTRTDQGTECDNIGVNVSLFHLCKEKESRLPLLALLTCADRRVVGNGVWSQAGLQLQSPERCQGPDPFVALLQGTDECVVRDTVRPRAVLPHPREKPQCPLPLLALLASTDRGVAGHTIGLEASLRHLHEEPQSLLPLRSSGASTNARTAGDHVWRAAALLHICQQAERPRPLPNPLTRSD
mmetsp:Transcript_59124/g.118318  ORF Transcript_59124/g.118318 Transcript_59124/m.118318 type:complete len:235 (+) Transcript_59124:373-1077(+)